MTVDHAAIREIVWMGGSTERGNRTPYAEFNAWADPEAAAAVLASGVPFTMVGLNLTHQALATGAVIERLAALATPLSDAVVGWLTVLRHDVPHALRLPRAAGPRPVRGRARRGAGRRRDRRRLRRDRDRGPLDARRDRGRPRRPARAGAERARGDRARRRALLGPRGRRGRAAGPLTCCRAALAALLVFVASGAVLVLEILGRAAARAVRRADARDLHDDHRRRARRDRARRRGRRPRGRPRPAAAAARAAAGRRRAARAAHGPARARCWGRRSRAPARRARWRSRCSRCCRRRPCSARSRRSSSSSQLGDLAASGTVVGRLSARGRPRARSPGRSRPASCSSRCCRSASTVIGIGALLVLAGLAVGAAVPRAAAAATAAAVAGAAALLAAVAALSGSRCADRERLLLRERRRRPRPPDAAARSMLDDLRHSYVDLERPAAPRVRLHALDGRRDRRACARRGEPLDAIFVGGGGFTLPRYLAATRPGSRSRVLEVDRQLVDLARDELGLRTGPDLRVEVGDARVTLRGEPDGSADLVVGDAFGGRSVPWHLATREFAADVRRVLRPDGDLPAQRDRLRRPRPAARRGGHAARRRSPTSRLVAAARPGGRQPRADRVRRDRCPPAVGSTRPRRAHARPRGGRAVRRGRRRRSPTTTPRRTSSLTAGT